MFWYYGLWTSLQNRTGHPIKYKMISYIILCHSLLQHSHNGNVQMIESSALKRTGCAIGPLGKGWPGKNKKQAWLHQHPATMFQPSPCHHHVFTKRNEASCLAACGRCNMHYTTIWKKLLPKCCHVMPPPAT